MSDMNLWNLIIKCKLFIFTIIIWSYKFLQTIIIGYSKWFYWAQIIRRSVEGFSNMSTVEG